MTIKLSFSDRDNVIDSYKNGTSVAKLSKEYGVAFTTVQRILIKAGLFSKVLRGREKLNIPEVIAAYENGLSATKIALQYGVNEKTVSRILHENGIPVFSRLYRVIDEDKAIAMYADGIGIKGVADALHCSRTKIANVLKKHGVHIRNASEQQQARMDRSTPEQIKHLTAKAHAATAGRKVSIETKRQIALTREKRLFGQSENERRLIDMLSAYGLTCIPQLAVGPYNCDIAIAPVAVEVLGGNWHWTGQHRSRAQERTYYFLNCGWHVLYIVANASSPLTVDTAKYVADFIHFARSNPSIQREYRVVWRAGEDVTRGCLDDDNFAFDPPFTNARDSANGRYKRIPR